MALVSPGVQVTVIDESFYTPAEPGTTPLIVIATAQDKPNAAGTATAAGTTKANAGKAFRITSQRELVETFGVPFFEKTASSTPIHGSERNEYGLLAAYSLLGVSNSVFITRADINLDELEAQATEPGSEPVDGQWWIDTAASLFGIQEWNGAAPTVSGGQKFSSKTPLVLTDDDDSKTSSGAPKSSVGSVGDYAVVVQTAQGGTSAYDASREAITYWYKSAGGTYALGSAVEAGQWVKLGSPEWKASHYVAISKTSGPFSTAGTSEIRINGNVIQISTNSTASQVAEAVNAIGISQGFSAKVVSGKVAFFSDGEDSDPAEDSTATEAGGLVFENVSGTMFGTGVSTDPTTPIDVKNGDLGIVAGLYRSPALQMTPHTSVPTWKTSQTPRPTGSVWVKTTTPNSGADYVIKKWDGDLKVWTRFSAPLYASTHNANYYLDRTGGGLGIDTDSLFVQHNTSESVGAPKADLRVWRRANAGQTVITSAIVTDTTFDFDFDDYVSGDSYSEGDVVKLTGKYYVCIQAHSTPAQDPETATNFWQRKEMGFYVYEGVTGQLALADVVRVAFFPKAYASTADAGVGLDNAEAFAAAVNGAGLGFVEASVTADNRIRIVHKAGGDFRVIDDEDVAERAFGKIFAAFDLEDGTDTENLYEIPGYASGIAWFASNWRPLVTEDYRASGTQPLEEPQDGQLWYNPNFSEVDIMAHNGEIWVGLNNHDDYTSSEVIVAASEPVLTLTQKGINNHIWISTADLENFPTIYRWNVNDSEWVLVDKTDQTTEDGILFADARYNTTGADSDVAGALADLLTSNYVDPDCPDPALYPRGMLLWNLRRSGGNIKRYVNNYINTGEANVRYRFDDNDVNEIAPPSGETMANYATDRWVTASANNEDGSGSFGRKAQRKVIVSAMKSVTDTSEEIRDEERRNFNIIAAPGYPELLSNLINLNIDRGLTAFVIGDTPLRLKSDATTLTNWGTNANLVFDNGDDGIVSYDEYCAVYYPNGFTTDLSGSNAVVPASHMMLRTIALSDSVSYPWFAPAGTRRGGITNATAVGYIDSLTGEFQTVALNEGQRDTLYDLKVNPIPFFVGVGHVAYGQKTRARNASALDRINVARLVVYLRSQLNKLARPYIFEPNDKITRDEIRGAVESLLLELVGLRAIYDFAVVCDESNNTPARIDRNELWVDVAIEPVKAVEFIYIPLRLKNTGEI
jgi:hypothetical protein